MEEEEGKMVLVMTVVTCVVSSLLFTTRQVNPSNPGAFRCSQLSTLQGTAQHSAHYFTSAERGKAVLRC